MAGRTGFFGIRQGEAPERNTEFDLGSDAREGSPFVRLGDLTGGNSSGFGSNGGGFDPVWGTLGPSPSAPAVDPWQTPTEAIEAGPIVEVDIFGDGFQIAGKICTGQFPRLSDWLNMQQGFFQVQEASVAHLGHGNMPDPDHQHGTMWVRLNQVVLVAERASTQGGRNGGLVVQKQKRRATIVTPGYSLRGFLHVHAHGSMKQFLESPDPHFIPITDLLLRWTSDPMLVGRFPFAMVNREQLISLCDEPTTPAGEGSAADADIDGMGLQRRIGAA
jgi:hypothetical protein